MATETPKFHRIAAGDYETADGVFRLRQLDAGKTQAWNVEWATDFENAHFDHDFIYSYPVDGARTKADALYFFDQWYQEHGHPDPEWKR